MMITGKPLCSLTLITVDNKSLPDNVSWIATSAEAAVLVP